MLHTVSCTVLHLHLHVRPSTCCTAFLCQTEPDHAKYTGVHPRHPQIHYSRDIILHKCIQLLYSTVPLTCKRKSQSGQPLWQRGSIAKHEPGQSFMFLLFLTKFVRSLAPNLFVLYGILGEILRTYLTRVPSTRNASRIVPLSSYYLSNKAARNTQHKNTQTHAGTCSAVGCGDPWQQKSVGTSANGCL